MNWSINSVHIQPSVSSVSASLHIMPVCYITSRRLNCRGLFYRIGTLAAIIKDPPNHTAYTPDIHDLRRREEKEKKQSQTSLGPGKKTFFILWQRRKKQNKTHCSSKGRRSSVTDNWVFVIFWKSKVLFSDANWFFFPLMAQLHWDTEIDMHLMRASVLLSDTCRLPSSRTRLSKGALLHQLNIVKHIPPKFKCSGLMNCWSWWKWMWHTSLSAEL